MPADTVCEIDLFDCRNEFLTNGKFWLHAVYENVIYGAIAIEEHGPEWVWLNDLFVVPGNRREGIGRRLVEAAVEHARVAVPTCIGCCAGIRRANFASQALFLSCGFRYVWEDADGTRLYSKEIR